MKYHVLYIGSVCSQRLISEILSTSDSRPNLAPQKFHRLFAEGMAMHPDLFEVSTISVPPVVRGINGRRLFSGKAEQENGVSYSYVPVLMIPVLRNILTALCTWLKILAWRFSGRGGNKVIICDILNVAISATTLVTARLCRVDTVTIVTDLPEMMFILKERPSAADRLTARFQNLSLRLSRGYIFLTEAMKEKVDVRGKPCFIMEGLSDIRMGDVPVPVKSESDTKIVLYSGGLYAKFGIKMLLDAFTGVKGENCELHLYGSGDMDELIEGYMKKDHRIRFFGYVPNHVVVEAQLKATLLVNPRFAGEEYTRYSFPSKNMEYMASGVPLVTTDLPGMPAEYREYVYIFKEETIDGYKDTLESILARPASELHAFGLKAKEFVCGRKNNKVQAERFHKFIQSGLRATHR